MGLFSIRKSEALKLEPEPEPLDELAVAQGELEKAKSGLAEARAEATRTAEEATAASQQFKDAPSNETYMAKAVAEALAVNAQDRIPAAAQRVEQAERARNRAELLQLHAYFVSVKAPEFAAEQEHWKAIVEIQDRLRVFRLELQLKDARMDVLKGELGITGIRIDEETGKAFTECYAGVDMVTGANIARCKHYLSGLGDQGRALSAGLDVAQRVTGVW